MHLRRECARFLELLRELHLLAKEHEQTFEWLVGREGGLLDQIKAAFPEDGAEADARPAAAVIPIHPGGAA